MATQGGGCTTHPALQTARVSCAIVPTLLERCFRAPARQVEQVRVTQRALEANMERTFAAAKRRISTQDATLRSLRSSRAATPPVLPQPAHVLEEAAVERTASGA